MTITDDEREAREWLKHAEHFEYLDDEDAKHRATILALLDAPRLPKPGTIPLEVLDAMFNAASDNPPDSSIPDMAAAYRALYDHYTKPAEPKKGIAWHVVKGTNWVAYDTRQAAEQYQRQFGGRIVKLVEDRDDQ